MADAFEDAFADIIKLGEDEATPPVATAPIPASAEPPAPAPVELEVPAEDDPAIPGAAAPEPVVPQAPQLDDAAVERLLAGLAAKVPQQQRQAPQAPQARQAPQALVNPQEAALINKYYEDWSDIAQASEIVTRVALQQQRQAIFAEMAAVLRPKLDMIDALATRAQLAYFEAKVPDYDKVTDAIGPWVQSQPDYLRDAYLSVMQNGTEDQVLDLITRYQQATGAAQAATPPARPATELSPTAKQAAARLAPVSAKRTVASAVAPAQDYDGAFAEAMKSI